MEKPGIKTTEFWLTLIAQVASLAVALGFITPDISSQVGDIAAKLAGVVVAVTTLISYIKGRSTVKAAAIAAGR